MLFELTTYCVFCVFAGLFHCGYPRLYSSRSVYAERLFQLMWLVVTWGHHVWNADW